MLIQGNALHLPLADESVQCVVTSPIRKTTLAYLAGIIDADGTIGIKKNSYAMRVVKDCEQATYSERVCVRQVEPEAVNLLHRLFGGSHRIDDPNAKRGKPLFSWQVTDIKAANLLRLLLPYFRIKKKQAENCLDLRSLKEQSKRLRVAKGRGHVGSAKRPIELSEAMEVLKLRANALNQAGRG